ncbi:hypothetical protein Tco_1371494 [Tanacetum coccineum]
MYRSEKRDVGEMMGGRGIGLDSWSWLLDDKVMDMGLSIQQKYICEKVFDLLKMLFDPFINGVAGLHDRHRDMRLNVDNMSYEDYMLYDPFINGVADLHDRHRDMRLDVDNMSYEELLALEERIGEVQTRLTEDVILKSMKQRKHMLFMDTAIVSSQQASVKGESSPIKRLSDVLSISEQVINGNVETAGSSWWTLSICLSIMSRSWIVNVGIEEKMPMEFRRKRTTSS